MTFKRYKGEDNELICMAGTKIASKLKEITSEQLDAQRCCNDIAARGNSGNDNQRLNHIKKETNNNLHCNENYNLFITKRQQRPLTRSLLIMLIIIITLVQMPQNSRVTAAVITKYQQQLLSDESAEKLSSSSSSSSSSATSLLSSLSPTQRSTRLRKRHSNYLYFHNNMHEHPTNVEWQNPCGGIFEPQTTNAYDDHFLRPPVRHYLKQLRRTAGFEYRTLNETLKDIDTSDMATWRLHRSRYKFLPALKSNSSVALKRWYRNMQTFVASFAYLGRIQYKWDLAKVMHASKTSHELNELLISARRLLCEIETAINGSYPRKNQQKLTITTRETMNKRLKFHTREYGEMGVVVEADLIDLKFAKDAYYKYLLNMWKILRRQTKRRSPLTIDSIESNLSYVSNSVANEDEDVSFNISLLSPPGEDASISESLEAFSQADQIN
ncbi:uncharacterized protein LOC119644747 [Glossina fuscipes]|uniref:Uncharacterized protein LOC119644747 n=1 Tax=Glossina fuscipes TaxID=7396 RepID=A0A9C6E432_9MUSC|nr:uncharacterized protein LOC119644747 [Glossina fuscipes]